jgi:hypothetical protein
MRYSTSSAEVCPIGTANPIVFEVPRNEIRVRLIACDLGVLSGHRASEERNEAQKDRA